MTSPGRLGSSAGQLPALGFGAAPLGNLYRPLTDGDAEALLQAAWNAGLRYFDTAPLYGFGLSERRLGAFLRQRPRDSFTVSTKVGRVLVPNEGWHPQRDYFIDAPAFEPIFDYSYDGIMRSFEASLERLGLDRIDILLMHDIGEKTHGVSHEDLFRVAMDGGYRAMEELRRSGAVGALGIGANEWQVCNLAMDRGDWDCFLLAGRYTLLEQGPLVPFLERCVREDKRIIIGGVFNSGILATGAVEGARFDYEAASADVSAKVRALGAACRAQQVPLAAAALQFPLAHPAVQNVIPGFGSKSELDEVLQWMAYAIPSGLWEELKREELIDARAPVPSDTTCVVLQ
ncbi:aldo/keto reductase [Parvibaculum sp.]|uniref:aldo/keto reductase n=1 Tax=Parvibaculum sp. TaxID=2024848 RepID=UPI002FD9970D